MEKTMIAMEPLMKTWNRLLSIAMRTVMDSVMLSEPTVQACTAPARLCN